jgi:hypothetical protein
MPPRRSWRRISFHCEDALASVIIKVHKLVRSELASRTLVTGS